MAASSMLFAVTERNLHKVPDKPYAELGHKETVDHCLRVALQHGYQISFGGLDVVYDEKEQALEYKAKKRLEDSIRAKGVRNLCYPKPWDTIKVIQEESEPCACGKVIGAFPTCTDPTGWCKSKCDCHTRIGRDLVHQCAIADCNVRTCNTMECPLKHFEAAHQYP